MSPRVVGSPPVTESSSGGALEAPQRLHALPSDFEPDSRVLGPASTKRTETATAALRYLASLRRRPFAAYRVVGPRLFSFSCRLWS
jgi:hypothetical protein